MSDSMEVDDYRRDRSRSPRRSDERRRSRSPPRRSYNDRREGGRDSYRGGRDSYRGGRDSYRGGRDSYRGGRDSYRGGRDSYRGGRDSYRGGRDFRAPPSAFQREKNIREYEIKSSRIHENSIFIGNLPYGTTWQDLKDYFKEVGEVVRADIVTSHGRPRGMGTVEFASRSLAEDAISQYDRSMFRGREIFVREDLPPPEKEDQRPEREDRGPSRYQSEGAPKRYIPPEGCEIFVGNLPFSARWQDLKDLFKPVGEIIRADIKADYNGRSKGFGTVVFEKPEYATKAIEDFNGYDFNGRRIDVRAGKVFAPVNAEAPSVVVTEFVKNVVGEGEPNEIIYVDNLPWETSQSDLFDLFGTIATVEKAELQFDRLGRPAGTAVVQFKDLQGAAAAIAQSDKYEYGNRELHVSYAKKEIPVQETSAPQASADVEAPIESQPTEDAPQVEPQPVAEVNDDMDDAPVIEE